ncbi:MAG: class I SAM-dependent methyltransferase [Candidatus Sericytochromatia bacterium]|nr:class I SAM-dependent methyltransferase [Candidatus Sericytochromatia bacterium]
MYIQAIYKLWARYYDDFNGWFSNWKGIRQAEVALEHALTTNLQTDSRILDLGCGTGYNVDRIARLGLPFADYRGLDLSEHMLEAARKKHGDRPDVHFDTIRLDSDALPEGEYDVVLSTWVFSHLAEPERLVQGIMERLKPGGLLLATFKAERNWLVDTLLWPCYKMYHALPVRRSSVARFPNMIRIERFWGGWATFIVCQRPLDPQPDLTVSIESQPAAVQSVEALPVRLTGQFAQG